MRRVLLIIVLVAAALFSALFGWLNPTTVTVDIGFAAFTAPLSFVCIVSVVLGWLLGIATGGVWSLREKRRKRRVEKDLKAREAELERARRLPVADGNG